MPKRRYTYRIILSIVISFFYFILLPKFVEESAEIINIEVSSDEFINGNFYGFGAETLPWLWTKENKTLGVNEKDVRLNLERIKELNLPITRIFVPWETWNPKVDYRTFTWESDKMKSLYKMLDFYQAAGTKVILVTVDWLKDSPWKNVEASAHAILELLEYLIRDKGYNCIQFWTLTNEPELTYNWLEKLPFENYVQIHRLVKGGLNKRGLAVKIIISDDVESQDWFERSIQSLHEEADVISSHAYLYPRQIHLVPMFFRTRLNIIKKLSREKKDIPFFLCEFGFRGYDFGPRTNSLIRDYEYGLYVAQLCVDALNSGVDAASLWCLHQIRLIDETNADGDKLMRIGLWAYKDEGWRPFPIFYLYQFFTRYIKSGSKVLKTRVSHPDILKAACAIHSDSYSLFVVNMTDEKQKFLINGINLQSFWKKYIYDKTELYFSDNNLFDSPYKVGDYIEDEIPPKSVILYTNLENDKLLSSEKLSIK